MHFATKQWVGYDPAATHEAAGGYWTYRERQALAGSCRSKHSHVRPLPSALRTFATQRPWTKFASAMQTGGSPG